MVITNCSDQITSVEEVGRLGRSDHSRNFIEIDLDTKEQENKTTGRAWRRADLEGMRNLLRQNRWSELLRTGTVNDAWEMLSAKLEDAVEGLYR